MDLLSIDNVFSTSSVPFDYVYIDKDEKNMIEEKIKDQYINLNNLGFDYLKDISEDELKINVLNDLISFVNNNYTAVVGFDSVFTKDTKEMGEYIYNFFCIDCYNMILPNLINQIKCYSYEEFERYYKDKLSYDSNLFKNKLILCIKSILDQVLKLSKIDNKITNDLSYKKLVKKYSYYIDLLDFGDASNLVSNYFNPLLIKHFDHILWRSN